jgi:hypothetical protein
MVASYLVGTAEQGYSPASLLRRRAILACLAAQHSPVGGS